MTAERYAHFVRKWQQTESHCWIRRKNPKARQPAAGWLVHLSLWSARLSLIISRREHKTIFTRDRVRLLSVRPLVWDARRTPAPLAVLVITFSRPGGGGQFKVSVLASCQGLGAPPTKSFLSASARAFVRVRARKSPWVLMRAAASNYYRGECSSRWLALASRRHATWILHSTLFRHSLGTRNLETYTHMYNFFNNHHHLFFSSCHNQMRPQTQATLSRTFSPPVWFFGRPQKSRRRDAITFRNRSLIPASFEQSQRMYMTSAVFLDHGWLLLLFICELAIWANWGYVAHIR